MNPAEHPAASSGFEKADPLSDPTSGQGAHSRAGLSDYPSAAWKCRDCGLPPEGHRWNVRYGVYECPEETSTAASTSRRPVRRLPGLCLYCGRHIYSHRRLACAAHRDLLLVDPLVNRAHLVLSEAERIRAGG